MKILFQQLFSRMYCISSKRDDAFLALFDIFLVTIGKSQNRYS
jgi:hypothetical protein